MSISPRILFTSKGAVVAAFNLPGRTGAVETGSLETMFHVGGVTYLSANYPYYMPVFLPCKVKVDGVVIRVGVASGNIDVGIYSSTGAKLVSSGSIACPAAGFQRIALTETQLNPGWYIAAIVANNSTATFYWNFGGAAPSLPSGYQVCGISSVSAFPLPATASITWGTIGSIWMRLVHS